MRSLNQLAAETRIAPHGFDVPLHVRHVAQANRAIAFVADHRIGDFVQIGRHGQISYHDLLGRIRQKSARGILDRLPCRVVYLLEAYA